MNKELVKNRGEGGQVLVLFVLALGVLVGFTAMAIDVGLLFEDRRHLQNTADAAALAGVAELPNNPSAAKAEAQNWVLKHNITADKIKTIEIRSTKVLNDTVYVEVEQDFEWIFGRVLGQTSSAVSAKAAARVGSLQGGHNVMPWAIVLGDTSCLTLTGQPLFNASCSVKVGAGDALTGWYGALDLDSNGGGSAEYKANIIDGLADTAYCIQGSPKPPCESYVINALPGNKVGGTGQGIDERLANEPSAGCDTNGNGTDDFGEVFFPNPDPVTDYIVGCPQSPRVILIPIVTLNGIPVKTVTIQGWALAYLEGYGCVGGTCNGKGHWEVQIRMVDAAYSETVGFLGAYNPLSGVTIRRLIE